MSDEFEITNEKAKRKSEIVKAMTDVECYPAIIEEQISLAKHTKLPLSQVTTLGTAFEPLTAAFHNVVKGDGTVSGLYHVSIPKGAHLAKFKNGSGYLGSVLKKNGAVGGGQAVLNPLVFNPAMLFMATTLANIERKLDTIQEMQRELLKFLAQKERSELRGDLNFLTDVLNKYKYNWNNEKFIDSHYIKVLGIMQGAERKIEFYREQITTRINKKSLVHGDQWVKNQLDDIYSGFKDYQLALYLYSFSSFLEVIFLENFKPEYLDGISKKIEDYSLKYNELSIICYDQIQKNAQSSLQSKMYKGSLSVSRGIGNHFAKDRELKKLFGMTTVLFTDKLEEIRSERIEQTLVDFKQFIEKQNNQIRPFVENINTVNKLYNQPIELVFDKENIYIGATEVQ